MLDINLLVLRNALSHGQIPSDSFKILDGLEKELPPVFGRIRSLQLLRVKDLLSDGKPIDAACEINVIHNLPISDQQVSAWDRDHFFRFELPNYFEMTQQDLAVFMNVLIDDFIIVNQIPST